MLLILKKIMMILKKIMMTLNKVMMILWKIMMILWKIIITNLFPDEDTAAGGAAEAMLALFATHIDSAINVCACRLHGQCAVSAPHFSSPPHAHHR